MPWPHTEKADVSVIVPVHGRTEYHRILSRHFKEAIKSSGLKIALTFVEHSQSREHEPFLEDWVNYIHIPIGHSLFNKCLAHNVGALYGPKADHFLFHDVDIIVPPDYFIKIFQNLEAGYDALQTFSKRRLWQADEYITGKLKVGEQFFNVIPWESRHVKELESGASGGSMFVKRELFFAIGGFDAELFTEYSIEDQMFFDKLKMKGRLGFCDDPAIDLLHLWHPPAFNRITKDFDFTVFDCFNKLNQDGLDRFFEIKSRWLKRYVSELDYKFSGYLERWKTLCNDHSSPEELINNEPARELIRLGAPILEWIIEDFYKTRWRGWTHVLEAITTCHIVPAHHQDSMNSIVQDWRDWFYKIHQRS
ncbi:MAG TPA: hypothetical protein VEA58_11740 [Anaerovoracaceae bacterium]|nr:hypothetical protein [Anaerovoracaceae bacterium]